MSRARPLVVISLAATSAAACGGKVVFDESATTDAASSSGDSGASSGSSTSTGGCDPGKHTIDLADFDTSCAVPSDCVAVFIGSYCGNCFCQNAAIASSSKPQYDAEAQAKQQPQGPGGCFCPAAIPDCVAGQCTTKVP